MAPKYAKFNNAWLFDPKYKDGLLNEKRNPTGLLSEVHALVL